MEISIKDKYVEDYVLKYHSELINTLKSIDENITLKDLLEILGDENELIIVISQESSGIQLISLTNKVLDEWTW